MVQPFSQAQPFDCESGYPHKSEGTVFQSISSIQIASVDKELRSGLPEHNVQTRLLATASSANLSSYALRDSLRATQRIERGVGSQHPRAGFGSSKAQSKVERTQIGIGFVTPVNLSGDVCGRQSSTQRSGNRRRLPSKSGY